MICVNVYQLFSIKSFDCCINIYDPFKNPDHVSKSLALGVYRNVNLISISHLQKNIHKLHVMVVRFFLFWMHGLKNVFYICTMLRNVHVTD